MYICCGSRLCFSSCGHEMPRTGRSGGEHDAILISERLACTPAVSAETRAVQEVAPHEPPPPTWLGRRLDAAGNKR